MRGIEGNVEMRRIERMEETLRKQLTTISWTSLPAYSPATSLRGLCSAGTYFVKRALRGSVWKQIRSAPRSKRKRRRKCTKTGGPGGINWSLVITSNVEG